MTMSLETSTSSIKKFARSRPFGGFLFRHFYGIFKVLIGIFNGKFMLEGPPKKEEQENVEVQKGLENKETEKEDYGIYLPTIDEASDPFLARQLIEWAKSANERLDKETVSVEKKLKLLDQLVNYWKTEKEESQEENEDLEKIRGLFDRIKILLELYQSENPFTAMLMAFKDKRVELDQQYVKFLTEPENRAAFSWTSKVKNIFSSEKARTDREKLLSSAEHDIESLFRQSVYEIRSIIEKNINEIEKNIPRTGDIIKIIRENYSDSREDNFSAIAEKLKEIKLQLGNFRKFFEDLQKELLERKLAEDVEVGWSSFNKEVKSFEGLLSSYQPKKTLDYKSNTIKEALEGSTFNAHDQLEKFFRNLEQEYRKLIKGDRIFHSNDITKTSVTEDFIVEMEKLQKKIIARKNGIIFWNEHCTEAVIKEAKDISSGRLLTHSGPTSVMYEVMRTGYLGSVDFLRKKLGKAGNRTHDMSAVDNLGYERETHDVTFDIDKIYKNFTSSEEELSRTGHVTNQMETANVAIIISENHILSQGNPYFFMDGVHVLDKKFVNEKISEGIGINLKEEPSMIVVVTEEERENFLNFLKAESFLKEDFSKMSGEEFSRWIENNVIFVGSLDDLKDRERQEIKDIKEEFLKKKGVNLKKGYVVVKKNIKASSKQNLGGPIKKFIPKS